MPQLVFSKRNPCASSVSDAETGQLIYNIETPFKFHHRTTTIRDPQGHIVAEYERSMSGGKVTVRGKRLDVSDFLAKRHVLGR